MATVLMVDLFRRLSDLSAFYTDDGLLPRDFVVDSFFVPGGWSLHLLDGSLAFQGVLWLVALVAAFLLMIGSYTRLVTLVSWALLLSLHNRAPIILNGGDELLRHALFWSLFLPLGARFSVDVALNTAEPKGSSGHAHCSGGTVALILQVMALYMFAGLLKTGAEWHGDGTAAYYALSIHQITTPLAPYLLAFPDALKLGTVAIYWAEILLPLLLIVPWRTAFFRGVAMGLLVGMHLMFAALFQLGLFPWMNLAVLLALLPAGFWDRWVRLSGSALGEGICIYYDGDCRVCVKGTHIFRTLLVIPHASLCRAQDDPQVNALMKDHNSWVVQDEAGQRFLKAEAFHRCLQASPWLFVIAPVFQRSLPLTTLMYEWVALNRPLLFQTTRWLRWRSLSFASSGGMSVLALVLAAYMLLLNGLPSEQKQALPAAVRWITTATGLAQSWTLFAPHPMRADGRYVVQYLSVERVVDEQPVSYPNERWAKLMIFMALPEPKPALVRQYADFVCRYPETGHAHDGVRIYHFLKPTVLPGESPAAVQQRLLWTQRCALPGDAPHSHGAP